MWTVQAGKVAAFQFVGWPSLRVLPFSMWLELGWFQPWKRVRAHGGQRVPCSMTQVSTGIKRGWEWSSHVLAFNSIQCDLEDWENGFCGQPAVSLNSCLSPTSFKVCWEWKQVVGSRERWVGQARGTKVQGNTKILNCPPAPPTTLGRAVLLLESNNQWRLFLICRNSKVSS